MRVLKPLTLARRRQLCAAPIRRDSLAPLADDAPPEDYDMREESRAFTDASSWQVSREAAE